MEMDPYETPLASLEGKDSRNGRKTSVRLLRYFATLLNMLLLLTSFFAYFGPPGRVGNDTHIITAITVVLVFAVLGNIHTWKRRPFLLWAAVVMNLLIGLFLLTGYLMMDDRGSVGSIGMLIVSVVTLINILAIMLHARENTRINLVAGANR